MADDFDPFDPSYNPAGTTNALGLSPNDPLYDWASNLKPSQVQQFIHDPEGFKQEMISRGVPPPEHHYDENMQPIRTDQSGRIQGNVSDYFGTPDARQAVAPPGGPRSKALGYSDPGGGFGQLPETEQLPPAARRETPLGDIGKAFIPPPITPQRAPKPAPEAKPKAVEPAPEVVPKVEKEPYVPPKEEEVAAVPTPTPDPRKAKEMEAREELSKFAKSLAGVKMPENPKLPQLTGLSVRSPHALTPNVQNLIGLLGARAATPAPVALMRLLGRA